MNSEELKNILKNGEESYNPQAWESLSKKLDLAMPVSNSSFFSSTNIFIAGISALIIGVGIYFLTTSTGSVYKSEELKVKSEKLGIKNETSTDSISPNSVDSASQNTTNSVSKHLTSSVSKNSNAVLNFEKKNVKPDLITPVTEDTRDKKQVEVKQFDNDNQTKFILPKIKKFYCSNEEITIKNENNSPLSIFDDTDNVEVSILGKDTKTFKLKKSGKYYFRNPKLDNTKVDYIFSDAFEIISPKTIDFYFEREIIYDKGLPYITLSTKDFYQNTSWKSSKGIFTEQAENTKLRVFNKGNYEVSLTQIDENSCKSTKTETISIDEEYNLMAPNAFRPLDLDDRTNHFIPFALTKRNVQFEMIILDPQTGRIVFKSNSDENAWDGIDINTGELVGVNKSFIWKVNLKNPEVKEKSEYTGTILRL
ncbi:MAG: hypothetical protein V4622_04255 [Bacteroidota bacterium]